MADKEKKQNGEEDGENSESSANEEAQAKKAGPSPIVLIVSALVTFIVFMGVFSFMMGVFDDAPTDTQSADATTEGADGSANYDSQPIVAEHAGAQETDPAADDDGIEFNFGGNKVDTVAEFSRLESERKKINADKLAIAVERKQLEALKREVKALLARKTVVDAEKIAYLAKLFDGMKQEEVSKVMSELENKTIVAVLPQMKAASAAKVLAMFDAKRAAKITTMLLGLDES